METMRRVALPARPGQRSLQQAFADTAPLVAGFLGLQLFLGYEWLMSGLSKLVAGTFASGLAATLEDMTQGQGGWYKSLVDSLFVPNGQLLGSLVMAGELTLGIVLIVTAVVLLTWRSRLSAKDHQVLLGAVALAAVVGAFMSLNFHLAMGAAPPWQIAPDPNDQGVDLDSLMVVMQLVLAAASLRQLASIRGARQGR